MRERPQPTETAQAITEDFNIVFCCAIFTKQSHFSDILKLVFPYWVATATVGQDAAMRAAVQDLEAGQVDNLIRNGFRTDNGDQVLAPPHQLATIVSELARNAAARPPPIHEDEVLSQASGTGQ